METALHLLIVDEIEKLRCTVDALFGPGTSKRMPDDVRLTHSSKNRRIRNAFHGERLLLTLRIDGGLAITPYFAQILLGADGFEENCVEIDAESEPFVREGKSVFCKHVVRCGRNVRVRSETPVLYGGSVIAVGRAVLGAPAIESLDRGVAVRIRDSLKTK